MYLEIDSACIFWTQTALHGATCVSKWRAPTRMLLLKAMCRLSPRQQCWAASSNLQCMILPGRKWICQWEQWPALEEQTSRLSPCCASSARASDHVINLNALRCSALMRVGYFLWMTINPCLKIFVLVTLILYSFSVFSSWLEIQVSHDDSLITCQCHKFIPGDILSGLSIDSLESLHKWLPLSNNSVLLLGQQMWQLPFFGAIYLFARHKNWQEPTW